MSHYFTNDKNLKSDIKKSRAVINDKEYLFKTDNGVFSKDGLDFGTRTLLETIPINTIDGNVLDLGCGYGPVGIFIKSNTNALVDMVDINDRALNLSKINAKDNKVDVNIFISNGYENITKKYDYIITNPPIKVGKKILYELLFSSIKYLNENGELWFVINKNHGAKSTVKELEKIYQVEIIKKHKGFFIVRCCK